MHAPTKTGRVRAKVIGVLRRGDAILVVESTTCIDGRRFFFAPGGGIEFGETAEAAVHRELSEEIGCKVAGLRRLGIIESIHEWNGQDEHEIVFAYAVETCDPHIMNVDALTLTEANGAVMTARWRELREIEQSGLLLYPDGLLALLREPAA